MPDEPDPGGGSIEALRREAAARRRELRDAQTENETLRTRLDTVHARRSRQWPRTILEHRLDGRLRSRERGSGVAALV
jgi:hypothetical protein